MRQRLLQDGPLGAYPTDDLLIDLPTACLAEGVQLQGEVLVARADPSIADVHATPQQFENLVVFPVHVPPRHRDLALPLTRRAWVYYNASPSGDVYASRGVDVAHHDPFPLLQDRH